MRKVIYICDVCGREYKYEIELGAKDRAMLQYIPTIKKEVCRKCIKIAFGIIKK